MEYGIPYSKLREVVESVKRYPDTRRAVVSGSAKLLILLGSSTVHGVVFEKMRLERQRAARLLRQKRVHRLAIFQRRLLEHPVAGIRDHRRLGTSDVFGQHAPHHGQASAGRAAADQQRRRLDRLRVRERVGLSLLVDLAEEGDGVVA